MQAAARPTELIRSGELSRSARSADLIALAILLAIFLVGLALRWDRLQYAEFTADQAWVINRAYDFVTRGDFPLAGIRSSVGTSQGPVEIWLLAIPVAISKDPVVASGFVGLLQMLAVAGTYFFVRPYFGRTTALVAAGLFAVNPWALQYSRKMWTPDMMPPFTVLLFASLFAAVVGKRSIHMAFAFFWGVVLFLIHPAAVVYAPLLLLVYAIFWRRLGWRPLLLGGTLGLAVAAPFLYYESQRGFVSFANYLGVSSAPSRMDLEALKYIVTMASAQYFPTMMGFGIRGSWTLPDQTVQNGLANLLLYAGLAFAAWQVLAKIGGRGRSDWEKYLLLLLWFVVPVAASARHSIELFPHYFVGIYPLQFVLIAVALAEAGDLARLIGARLGLDLGRAAVAAIVGLSVYLGLSQLLYFRTYVDYVERQGPQGAYGVPLLHSQLAVDTLRDLRARYGYDRVYVYSYLQQRALDYLGRPDLTMRQVDPPEGLLLPNDPSAGAIVMLASDDSAIKGRDYHLLDEGREKIKALRSFGFVELPERAVRGPDGHHYFKFFYLPPGQMSDELGTFARLPQEPRLANGMRLLGFKSSPPPRRGGKAALALLWQLPDAPERYVWREYNLFVHAVDRDGRVLAQQDKELFQYMAWRADDLLVSFHELELPPDYAPGLAWFDVGAYSRFDRAQVPWLDAKGQPAGDAFKVGPLKVPPVASQQPQVASAFTFGTALQLSGYSVAPAAPVAGGDLAVSLHWRALGKPDGDYTVSVQLLDGAGKLVAQHDAPPRGGNYPTAHWEAGEEVVDTHAVSLPPDLPAGRYELVGVVYSSATKARLLAVPAGGGQSADHARLGTLTIEGRRGG